MSSTPNQEQDKAGKTPPQEPPQLEPEAAKVLF